MDSITTIDLGNYYAILPNTKDFLDDYKNANINFNKVEEGFSYNSGQNKDFLDIQTIRKIIKENINKDFVPR